MKILSEHLGAPVTGRDWALVQSQRRLSLSPPFLVVTEETMSEKSRAEFESRAVKRWGHHQFQTTWKNSSGVLVETGSCVRCGYGEDHPIHEKEASREVA